jgi:hypothetical protein
MQKMQTCVACDHDALQISGWRRTRRACTLKLSGSGRRRVASDLRAAAVAVLALMWATAAHAQAGQFDLQCKGERVNDHNDHGRHSFSTIAFTAHYRLDLAKGLYCEGECREAQQIGSIQEAQILLYDRADIHGKDWLGLDRAKGLLVGLKTNKPDLYMAIYDNVTINGTCERQEFSGLPALKF